MNHNNIRYIGRHIQKGGREYFSFSGSGFIFGIAPHRLVATIKISLISEVREFDTQYIAIYINNVLYNKEALISGVNEKYIYLPNSDNKTIIKVIKLNEAFYSSIYLDDIVVHQSKLIKIDPSQNKLIGFYGDSITCGYGITDYKGEDFKMESEDFSKTYANLASNALNMDYTVVARSGISIAIPIFETKLFSEIYDTVDMYEKGKDERKIDFAVINLGTNDNSAYFQVVKDSDKNDALESFICNYIKLIENIIFDNPNVRIIMCYNMLVIEKVIIEALEKIHKYVLSHFSNRCRLLEFIPNSDGACLHPYQDAHKQNAKILIKEIHNILSEE